MGTGDVQMKKLEELQQEKLVAEINLINAKIKKEYPENKPPRRSDRIADFIKKWYAIVLAIIAVGGGFWGVFAPVKSYFNERNKAVQYELNQNMIKAMEQLESEDYIAKENAIMILGYYDLNAIPIFLDKLEKADWEDEILRPKYIEAINLIYKRKRADIVNKIIVKMEYNFNEISQDNPELIYPLINLSVLIENLKLVRQDRTDVMNLYENIKNKIETDSTLSQIDGVTLLTDRINEFIDNK